MVPSEYSRKYIIKSNRQYVVQLPPSNAPIREASAVDRD
jgi:hypothetical protein